MKLRITEIVEVEAVQWDGSDESWAKVCDLPWDDCYVSKGEPGKIWRNHFPQPVRVGDLVYPDDYGVLHVTSRDTEGVEVLS